MMADALPKGQFADLPFTKGKRELSVIFATSLSQNLKISFTLIHICFFKGDTYANPASSQQKET